MLRAAFARFRREEAGATAIEYGLIVALIAVALLGALSLVGVSVENLYASGVGTAAAVMAAAVAGQ